MQTKLSKLQKAILIFIYQNRHSFVLGKSPKEKMVFYEELRCHLVEEFDKLVECKRGMKIKQSFFGTPGRSIDSLVKRKLISQTKDSTGLARYLALTPEGVETAEELLR